VLDTCTGVSAVGANGQLVGEKGLGLNTQALQGYGRKRRARLLPGRKKHVHFPGRPLPAEIQTQGL